MGLSGGDAAGQGVSRSYKPHRAWWFALDLLFPPICAGCGHPGSRWCSACQEKTPCLAPPLCLVCGMPLAAPATHCADCRRTPPRFRALRSWSGFEGPLRNALHRLKYRRDIGLGEALAPQFSQFALGLGWHTEVVVPVPLSRERLNQRGYNQAELIAWPLADALHLPFDRGAVARVRDTLSQVGLSKIQRQNNVRSAFSADPAKMKKRAVLLVDDVATTGSTLSSCAEALYAAGAREVLALTVARALPHQV